MTELCRPAHQSSIRIEVSRRTGRVAVAIIGHAMWTREFGRDLTVAGRTIQVSGQTFQIIGIAPRGFAGTSQNCLLETHIAADLPSISGDKEALSTAIRNLLDSL